MYVIANRDDLREALLEDGLEIKFMRLLESYTITKRLKKNTNYEAR